jgi:exosome complex exonuclease DIS3/RRP44
MSNTTNQSRWSARAHTVLTRRGRVIRKVREHYLRDDLGCGTLCHIGLQPLRIEELPAAPVTKSGMGDSIYLVLDTNVVLKQMDLLEHTVENNVVGAGPLSRCIILQTVLDEVKHQNLSIFNRLQSLLTSPERQHVMFPNEHHTDTYIETNVGETPNDRNDRAIRVATKWFQDNHSHNANVILVTNDRENKMIARKEGIEAVSIEEYVSKYVDTYPELGDLVAAPSESASSSRGSGTITNKRNAIYELHKPMSELAAGIKAGKYYQGAIRMNQYNSQQGKVKVRSETIDRPILISGREHLNRAFDGDIVAVELLPKETWSSINKGNVSSTSIQVRDEHGIEDDDKILDKASIESSVWSGDLMNDDGGNSDGGNSDESCDTNESNLQPCGRIVGIVDRKWRSYCGSIEPRSGIAGHSGGGSSTTTTSTRCLFIPVKRNVPKIRVTTRQVDKLSEMRIIVAVDSWSIYDAYPTGHYVRTLGPIGDRETETQVVLIEHNIPTDEFSPRVMRCLPAKDWVVTDDKIDSKRVDLRHLVVCSIDPPGCKDIDDALHARMLPNGRLECGVHIADVTYFVKHDSAIDVEARDRSTSTYLVERRLDMLPGLLTTHLCSLRGGIDRFCFSVIWELNPDTLEILDVRFHKSVIHSRAALTYDQAQLMLDNPNDKGDVQDGVRFLNSVAVRLRKKRMDAGALTLASPEVRFQLDEATQDPTDVKMYNLKQANALVEEFMLFANITVAKQITSVFPRYALLRRHPVPQRQNFDGLIAAASIAGHKIKVDTSKELADSLDLAVLDGSPYFNKLLRIMATRCMSQAVYFCSGELSEAEYRHYGLATPIYTHFTSPIRRYADVVVHRLLSASIGLEPLPASYENKDGMRIVTENMNYRHHNAQMAGRASVGLHTLLYFKNRPTIDTACVIKIKSNGAVVLVPKYGIEGPVYVCKKGGESSSGYRFEEKNMSLINLKDDTKSIKIFQEIQVKIEVVEVAPHRNSLVMSLIWPDGNKRSNSAIDGNQVTTKMIKRSRK